MLDHGASEPRARIRSIHLPDGISARGAPASVTSCDGLSRRTTAPIPKQVSSGDNAPALRFAKGGTWRPLLLRER